MTKRITIAISDELYEKLREIQGEWIMKEKRDYSFSAVIEKLLWKVLRSEKDV